MQLQEKGRIFPLFFLAKSAFCVRISLYTCIHAPDGTEMSFLRDHDRRHSGRRISTGSALWKKLISILLCVALLVTAFILLRNEENKPEPRGSVSEGFYSNLSDTIVNVNGKDYRERKDLTSILLIGYDKTENSSNYGYRNGGQSDFMLLLVLDENGKTVRRLQLERDTMTEVKVLSVLGKDAGTNTLQLCLSHGYGNVPEECNQRTVEAVSHLLQGIEIPFYIAMNLDGVSVLNDALGGVDVLIEDDFTGVDDTLLQGQTVHLEGKHATTYLRSRKAIGSGTNEERMRRHRTYLEAAEKQLHTRLSRDKSFANTFFSDTDGILETNLSRGRLINELNRAKDYDILPVETYAGEYKLGKDNYVEFWPDEESILSWILNTYYVPVS